MNHSGGPPRGPQPGAGMSYMGASGRGPHPVSPPPYMGPRPQAGPPVHAPPPGYGAPPGAHAAYGAPPVHAQGGVPSTVFGHALWPGERVLYYKYIPGLGARLFYILFGIPMILLVGLGFYLIYMGITHRRQFAYAQVITNKRLFTLDGRGQEMRGMTWADVRGLNKVAHSTGMVREFGVRNAQGAQCMFNEDLATVERLVTLLAEQPAQRDALPEVPFDRDVH